MVTMVRSGPAWKTAVVTFADWDPGALGLRPDRPGNPQLRPRTRLRRGHPQTLRRPLIARLRTVGAILVLACVYWPTCYVVARVISWIAGPGPDATSRP